MTMEKLVLEMGTQWGELVMGGAGRHCTKTGNVDLFIISGSRANEVNIPQNIMGLSLPK